MGAPRRGARRPRPRPPARRGRLQQPRRGAPRGRAHSRLRGGEHRPRRHSPVAGLRRGADGAARARAPRAVAAGRRLGRQRAGPPIPAPTRGAGARVAGLVRPPRLRYAPAGRLRRPRLRLRRRQGGARPLVRRRLRRVGGAPGGRLRGRGGRLRRRRRRRRRARLRRRGLRPRACPVGRGRLPALERPARRADARAARGRRGARLPGHALQPHRRPLGRGRGGALDALRLPRAGLRRLQRRGRHSGLRCDSAPQQRRVPRPRRRDGARALGRQRGLRRGGRRRRPRHPRPPGARRGRGLSPRPRRLHCPAPLDRRCALGGRDTRRLRPVARGHPPLRNRGLLAAGPRAHERRRALDRAHRAGGRGRARAAAGGRGRGLALAAPRRGGPARRLVRRRGRGLRPRHGRGGRAPPAPRRGLVGARGGRGDARLRHRGRRPRRPPLRAPRARGAWRPAAAGRGG